MSSKSTLSRRRFLKAGSISTLLLAIPELWSWAAPPLQQEVLTQSELLVILGDPERVCELGRCYRSAVPTERTREALNAALHEDCPAGSPAHRHLQERIREDFATGRTIQLDGWVLSVTEARQCALYSLLLG